MIQSAAASNGILRRWREGLEEDRSSDGINGSRNRGNGEGNAASEGSQPLVNYSSLNNEVCTL